MNKVSYLILVLSIVFFSCERFKIEGNERTISTFSEDESHYKGDNCMDCHTTDGRGEGWFSVAGSVYGNTDKAVVKLWSEPNGKGQLIRTIQVDKLGNFYTTELVEFDKPVYVQVVKDNQTENMEEGIYSGACNMCHGITTEKIKID